MRTVYVITAVHNRYEITERFVENLLNQRYQAFSLILVDDGSTDGTDGMVKSRLPLSTVLYGDGNLWWGGALHKAYQYVRSQNVDPEDCVLLINDDTHMGEDFLENGVKLLEAHPDTFIPALCYSLNDGSLLDGAVHWDFRTGDNWVLQPDEEGNCASTRALFFRVKDFLKVGGFHPVLLPHYGSDYEFGIRAWKKGFRIRSFSELSCRFDDKTTGDRDYSKYKLRDLLRRMFSKRSSFNPFYKLNLLLMVTPPLYLPKVMWHQLRQKSRTIGSKA